MNRSWFFAALLFGCGLGTGMLLEHRSAPVIKSPPSAAGTAMSEARGRAATPDKPVPVEEFSIRLQQAKSQKTYAQRIDQLQSLAGEISQTDIPQALEEAKGLPLSLRGPFVETLISRWAD